MYTMQPAEFSSHPDAYCIFDPDGDLICEVISEAGALALLTHLNNR